MSSVKVCTLMVHNPSHNSEDIIINNELFNNIMPGDFISIADIDSNNDNNKLILQVPNKSQESISNRLEISISKAIADSNNLKPFSKVIIDIITDINDNIIDYVELSFKKQYLERGSVFRLKKAMIGRPVFVNQNIEVNKLQAVIHELHQGSTLRRSGIITEQTKFIFRSKSARIVWLVQISAEMWDFDQNGDLYYEKFLRDFISPMIDQWKAMQVTHMLTIIFFARTFFLERVTATNNPDLFNKKSFCETEDGVQYQDFFKIVIENAEGLDKTTQIQQLREEFWLLPKLLGWRIPANVLSVTPWKLKSNNNNNNNSFVAPELSESSTRKSSCSPTSDNIINNDIENLLSNDYPMLDSIATATATTIDTDAIPLLTRSRSMSSENRPTNINEGNTTINNTLHHKIPSRSYISRQTSRQGNEASDRNDYSPSGSVDFAVPSDCLHGNFLEAINTALNILDKHHMDRDLQRTNNSIVVISAGCGIFKVKPSLSQITKQRMLDNAFGIDYISLSRPMVRSVPLFLVDCKSESVKSFYEMPHWMRVSFIDCRKEIRDSLDEEMQEYYNEIYDNDNNHCSNECSFFREHVGFKDGADLAWIQKFKFQPITNLLTSLLMNSTDLRQLAVTYANTLPLSLREIISFESASVLHTSDKKPVKSFETPSRTSSGEEAKTRQLKIDGIQGEDSHNSANFKTIDATLKSDNSDSNNSKNIANNNNNKMQKELTWVAPPSGTILNDNNIVLSANIADIPPLITTRQKPPALFSTNFDSQYNKDWYPESYLPYNTLYYSDVKIPTWGALDSIPQQIITNLSTNIDTSAKKLPSMINSKSAFVRSDIIDMKLLSITKDSNIESSIAIPHRLKEALDDIPMLKRDREDSISGSLGSILGDASDYFDELNASFHSGHQSVTNSTFRASYSRKEEEMVYDQHIASSFNSNDSGILGYAAAQQINQHNKVSMHRSSVTNTLINQREHRHDNISLNSSHSSVRINAKDHHFHRKSDHQMSPSWYPETKSRSNTVMRQSEINLTQNHQKNLEVAIEDLNNRRSILIKLSSVSASSESVDSLREMMESYDKNIFLSPAQLSELKAKENDAKFINASDAGKDDPANGSWSASSDHIGMSIDKSESDDRGTVRNEREASHTVPHQNDHAKIAHSNQANDMQTSTTQPPSIESITSTVQSSNTHGDMQVPMSVAGSSNSIKKTPSKTIYGNNYQQGSRYGNSMANRLLRSSHSRLPVMPIKTSNQPMTISSSTTSSSTVTNETNQERHAASNSAGKLPIHELNHSATAGFTKLNDTKSSNEVSAHGIDATKRGIPPKPQNVQQKGLPNKPASIVANSGNSQQGPRLAPSTAKIRTGRGGQQFAIHHGKIVPVLAPTDTDAQKRSEKIAEYLRQYSQLHCINPFKSSDSRSYVKTLTHNRRRWAHVYPQGKFQRLNVNFGLNWKSLTQPAMLPLTTDYIPSINHMEHNYDVDGFYHLLVDQHESPFLTAEDLMQEMICLRLSQEYQLIEGFDSAHYLKFNNSSAGPRSLNHANSRQYSSYRAAGGVIHGRLANNFGDRTAPANHLQGNAGEDTSRDGVGARKQNHSVLDNGGQLVPSNFYILSMGHRIQFLQYDSQGVNVTVYRSKRGLNKDTEMTDYTYKYEIWVPQIKKFQTITQTFHKFIVPEFKWNKLDNTVVGNLDYDPFDDSMRSKRLSFCIIPIQKFNSDQDVDEYLNNIDKLQSFLNNYITIGNTVAFNKDRNFIDAPVFSIGNISNNTSSPSIGLSPSGKSNTSFNSFVQSPIMNALSNGIGIAEMKSITPPLIYNDNSVSTSRSFHIDNTNDNTITTVDEPISVLSNEKIIDALEIDTAASTNTDVDFKPAILSPLSSGDERSRNVTPVMPVSLEKQINVTLGNTIENDSTKKYLECLMSSEAVTVDLPPLPVPQCSRESSLSSTAKEPARALSADTGSAPYLGKPLSQSYSTIAGVSNSELAASSYKSNLSGKNIHPVGPQLTLPSTNSTPSLTVASSSSALSMKMPPNPPPAKITTRGGAVANLSAMSAYQTTAVHDVMVTKLITRGPRHENPNWIYLKYDRTVHTYKPLHLDFHWMVCDSCLVDELVTLLFRRCQRWGLRLCHIPQYFESPNLNVHPFRAIPHIYVPRTLIEIPRQFPTPLRMVERLFFMHGGGWLFDNELRTDWPSIGLPVPSYFDRDRDLLAPSDTNASSTASASTDNSSEVQQAKPNAFSSLSKSISRMVGGIGGGNSTSSDNNNLSATSGRKPSTSKRLDRQYIHLTGLAMVRITGQGFLWMNNSTSRVSDINLPIDEKQNQMVAEMNSLERSCESIVLCYELLVEVTRFALDYSECQELLLEVIDKSIALSEKNAEMDRERAAAEKAKLIEITTEKIGEEVTAIVERAIIDSTFDGAAYSAVKEAVEAIIISQSIQDLSLSDSAANSPHDNVNNISQVFDSELSHVPLDEKSEDNNNSISNNDSNNSSASSILDINDDEVFKHRKMHRAGYVEVERNNSSSCKNIDNITTKESNSSNSDNAVQISIVESTQSEPAEVVSPSNEVAESVVDAVSSGVNSTAENEQYQSRNLRSNTNSSGSSSDA